MTAEDCDLPVASARAGQGELGLGSQRPRDSSAKIRQGRERKQHPRAGVVDMHVLIGEVRQGAGLNQQSFASLIDRNIALPIGQRCESKRQDKPAARLAVRVLRRRVAARRLSETKAWISSVAGGAPHGREAIQRSASSSARRAELKPVRMCPATDHRRAASPSSVCFLIHPMSVCNASTSWSMLASKWVGSSKRMKFNRRNVSGTARSSTVRHTTGAKRLLSEVA
jgi:hypothetical protein